MRNGECEVWITYSVKYGNGHQLDREPNTYYNLAFFDNELAALRWANTLSAKTIQVFHSESIEDAIKREGQRG